ncbi:DNA-3-methyladenine glycosylase family protein [Enterovibrio norvegicus]|uniref:DNA-3-methyladenine glycosylase family protein n=1 Tax=Enterovibrio norvegicus TaxID=188144 RepID=UPI000C8563EA|nr:DNA-3-methyladenine glycosylase 2 [Enterovibrio norvegicus]PMN65501.1 3-methyladenine DNA glycosylase 2 [Enterovibrio norvegicus]
MPSTQSISLPLPSNFRYQDFIGFHQRDKTELSEKVDGMEIHKGVLMNAIPCRLSLSLGSENATMTINADADENALSDSEMALLAGRMLGLQQDIAGFESKYQNHPDISRLLSHQHGLRIPQTTTPFEAISWAITGQLISVEAAISIRRRLIEATGKPHSSGIWCLPDEHILANTDIDTYRACGYSNSKATTLQRIAKAIVAKELDLSPDRDPLDAGKELLAIKGIGPWTVSYTLLRGFGYLDGSLHGDVAVRRNIQRLLDSDEKPTEKEAQKWLTEFAPWRALVAAHLWAMDKDKAY